MKQAANFVGFQIGWWTSVLGAAGNRPWLGPITVGLLLIGHLWAAHDRVNEARLVLFVGVLGTATDSALRLCGVLAFPAEAAPSWLAPPWLIAVWLIFATTLRWSLSWLGRTPWVAALAGGLAGPLSYYAGARLGALRLGEPLSQSLAVLGLEWSLMLPALFFCARTQRLAPVSEQHG